MNKLKQLSETLRAKLGIARSITPDEQGSERDPWLQYAMRYQNMLAHNKAPTLTHYKKMVSKK